MQLEEDIDFTTLGWVKPQIDETLLQARQALEAYVEDPADTSLMRFCATYLHQVQGTLRMVELYGAAMLAEEMEHLSQALLDGGVANRDDAYAALMRGLVQLPDYLERVQAGHKDIPIVLLPLLNELRAGRGEKSMAESALFAPDIERSLPAEAAGAHAVLPSGDLRRRTAAIRVRFQAPLLAWFRDDAQFDFAELRAALDDLGAISHTLPARRLWWISGGVLEALQQGRLVEYGTAVKQQFGQVDRAIKKIQDDGEEALADEESRDLCRTLLYFAAHAAPGAGRTDAIREIYALDALLPSAEELEHARGSMSGRNRVLLDTVSKALKDDLLRVKEALDIFLRREGGDPAELAPQAETLRRVGDTLGMLGLGVPRRVVAEQRETIEAIVSGVQTPQEETLLDVAGALLYVDASLDDHIERLGAATQEETQPGALSRIETRKIVDALMREAGVNLARVKDDIVAFIESPWAHDRVLGVPKLLDEVGGALRMLDLARPTELLGGIGRFVENELIADRRIPTAEEMDMLADAMAGIEYYLEASRDVRGSGESILNGTQRSLEALGYWPLPARREATAAPAQEQTAAVPVPELTEAVSLAPGSRLEDLVVGVAAAAVPTAHELAGLHLPQTEATAPPPMVEDETIAATSDAAGEGDGEWIEVEEEVDEFLSTEANAETASFQDAVGIDEDIRGVFVEEVGEEIASIREHLPAWKMNPEDLETLKPVRRSFHTLKGSGRLVGALALGEFSWRVENMLNRVLDRSIAPDEDAQALVDHALAALPHLHAALKGEGEPCAPLAAIMQAADKLAAGEPARIEDFLRTQKVRRRVRRWVTQRQAAEAVPVATLAGISDADTVTAPAEMTTPAAADPVVTISALPPVDPMLLEILRSEVAQHLDTMRDYLARCDAGAPPVDAALVRAAHTLHGAVAMVDIPVVVAVLTSLETWLRRALAAGVAPEREGVDALRDAVALTDQVIAQFDAVSPVLPDSAELAERLASLRDGLPEADMATLLHFPDGGLHTDFATPDHPAGFGEHDAPTHPAVEAGANDAEQAMAFAVDAAGMGSEAATLPETESLLPTAEATTVSAAPLETALPDEVAIAAERAQAEREAVEKAEAERAEAERSAAEQAEAERAEAERFAAAKIEAEQEAERAEAERIAAEQAEVERAEAERFAAAKIEAEQEAERAEAERIAAEQAKVEQAEAERVEAERIAAEQAKVEQAEAERVEAERIAAEQAKVEQAEAERVEAERIAAEQAEVEQAEAERAATARQLEEARRSRAALEAALPAFPDDPQPDGKLELPDIDADLLEIFTQEGVDLLDHADGLMAVLRDSPQDREPIAGLQRDLHTLKGGARVAGIAEIGDLGHAMETLLETIAEGRRDVDPLVTESLERGFDRLHDLLQRVIRGRALAMPAKAIARFEALAEGRSPVTEEPAAAKKRKTTSRPAPRVAPSFDDEPHAPQEMIRVRSDLLDSLVNYAGEVSIYRSRLEQQVANFRFNLVELEQTVSRLRDQLRKLEIETEAQILSRYQRENEGAHGATFDPLELDRFSQLQQYSRALAESVSDLVSIQGILDDQTRQSETLLLQQSRVSSDLQEGLMRTRMVPFDSLVPSLRRTLRQAASELGKRAQLRVDGAQGEMDRNLLERMKAPFEHMLRNALAHGIEDPDQRTAGGKPEEGTVAIQVGREATEVLIRVSDDGAGFDRDAIRAKAIERGLLHPDVELSDRDLFAFVLETGFSTAESVNQIAGRGVGMDVVANEIKLLGGTLTIDSERKRGTTFNIRLPFTLAVTQAIMVRTGETVYAVPMTSIQGVARITHEELDKRLAGENPVFMYAGEDYAIHDLSQLLGLPATHLVDENQLPLLMIRSGDLRAAVRIDAVVGSREIVVKSVGPQLSSVPGIFGATIMGDGSVVLILDLAPLVRRTVALRESAAVTAAEHAPTQPAAAEREEQHQPLVMVVDDSITMRKVTTRVLERQGLEVNTAKDGLDAVEKLQDRVPDLMLLDIEMPRMDGYELATYMKNDPRLRDVPIIMITSRTGEKHRQRAFEIGVERYLGKPYNEADLLRNVHEMLEASHV